MWENDIKGSLSNMLRGPMINALTWPLGSSKHNMQPYFKRMRSCDLFTEQSIATNMRCSLSS